MAKGFSLRINPWVYVARFIGEDRWEERYIEQPHQSPGEEAALSDEAREELLSRRNSIAGLPLVNYTTQYGFGVFEGIKALPQKDGGYRIFRPDRNAERMANSMRGLRMPAFPERMFIDACIGVVARNAELGFLTPYNPAWQKDDFLSGESVYMRPFSYSEPGIGLNLSHAPSVVVVTTNVGAYFEPGRSKAVTTDKVRAFPGGTGWIKCDANYVTPTLVKYAVMEQGYMEALFLDAREQKYFEEGSSCNLFFLMKDGTLATPELGDTILPGVTRRSILELAASMGIPTAERRIAVDEAFADARECFVTGTAAGIAFIESITHKGRTVVFNNGRMGDTTRSLLLTLKGIQYGAIEDRFGWMVDVRLPQRVPAARPA
jgi:branched-chain amino acid aminotransferase